MFSRCLERLLKQNHYTNYKYLLRMISISSNNETHWNPQNVTDIANIESGNYAIVVLNRKILIDPNIVKCLWDKANIRVCVDGGANRWMSFLNQFCQNEEIKSPDYITGDFDSITGETLKFFTNSISQHVNLPEQDDTDFTKSLKLIAEKATEKSIKYIVVIQENSGRFDHIMANINTLFKANVFLSKINLYLLSSNSISWLLEPGKHSISISQELVNRKGWCSLIPVGQSCSVTTNGLKWDMTNQKTEFGGIVSTSNTYTSQTIQIESTGFLLWCMGVYNFHDD